MSIKKNDDLDDLIGKLFYSHLEDDEWKNIPEGKISSQKINKLVTIWHRKGGVVMSRKRIIDTAIYFDTEICSLLGERGLHLYIRLWGISEDSAVYLPNYADIALQMGALRFTEEEVKNYIEKLVASKKIIPFNGNGKTYHWLKNFFKHQPLRNPTIPRLPIPEWIGLEVKAYPKTQKKFAKFTIIKDKIPPDYLDCIGSLLVDYQESELQSTTSSLPVAGITIEIETEKEIEKEIETETEKKDLSLFSDFWIVYPARSGKKLEKSETQRRFSKLKLEDQKLCVIAAKNYSESKMVKSGFGIKDPKRFILDGKGNEPWRDWIEPEKTGESENGKSGNGKTIGHSNANTGKTQGTELGLKPKPGEYDRKPTYTSGDDQ